MGRVKMCCFVLLIFSDLLQCVGDNSTTVEVEVEVREGDDAILPCSFNPVQDIPGKLFDWKKDKEKEVFLFDDGPVYNEGRSGQDRQFSGRVTHFPDELEYGNASIRIRSATVADSGNYTCVFPRDNEQIYIIRLLVGVPARPNLTVTDATEDGVRLRCEVEGAHRRPEVAMVNSSGHVLSSEEPQVSEENGRYNVTILTTINETGLVRCRVKQKEISHEAFSDVYVYFHEQTNKWEIDLLIVNVTGVILAVIGAMVYSAKRCKIHKLLEKGPPDGGEEPVQEVLIHATANGSSRAVKNSAASDDTPSSKQTTAII
ncbi:V-set domain-containing T-cell activation inhibitor 1-like isoform X2 [Nelusetta ayraudi]|uniref:V-set domain-containing T-cell activation inhibitor 1-like isoform X2 n=1 Tax=Nelusetta ayraudi TaxID=303726 RepID=UPI003F6F2988